MATAVSNTARILVVEDQADLAEPVVKNLREDGFEASHAATGEAARRLLDSHWDLVILDLMLPDVSGESILSYLRQRVDYPNVLVLSAKSGLQERLNLFRLGCDDYLTKPFMYEELLERVRAVLRRARKVSTDELAYQDLRLEFEKARLFAGETSVGLTPKEAAICRILLSQPERIVSRREILHSVWGFKEEPDSNFIGVHIFNLRKKFSQLGRGDWFQTVRASGFVVCNPETGFHDA